jgi:hypothetical protein
MSNFNPLGPGAFGVPADINAVDKVVNAPVDAQGQHVYDPTLGHNVEQEVKARAIAAGKDPEKVWMFAQTADKNTQFALMAGNFKSLPNDAKGSKLEDSALVKYFVTAGVDKALAVKALKKNAGVVGTQTEAGTPDLVAKVLVNFADPKNGSSTDDQKKISTYLQSDSAGNSGVTAAAKTLGVDAQGNVTTNASGNGVQNSSTGGFNPSAATGGGTVDDQYLTALKNQAKSFLTGDQVQFLGSTQSADALLNAIGGQGGSDEAATAMRNLFQATTGTNSSIPSEGIGNAANTMVNMTPPQPNQFTAGDMVDSPFSTQPNDQAQSSIDSFANNFQQMAGSKTVNQALRMLPTMSQTELTNLQRKLSDAGYIAQVASGGAYEPDMWGDPTDPSTQAAWKQLLADSLTTGKDVQSLLAQRTASFAPKLAQMQVDKANADKAKALATAKQNQVTVDSTDNLIAAMRKLTSGGALLGHDLSNDEMTAMAAHVQQLEAQQQTAQNQGSSYVPQVDPAATMQESMIAAHPVDYLAQQTANSTDIWKRLLSTPGGTA